MRAWAKLPGQFVGLVLAAILLGSPATAQVLGPAAPPRIPTVPETPGVRGGDSGPGPSVPDIFDTQGNDTEIDRQGPLSDGAEAIPNEICVVFPPSADAGTAAAFAGDLELELVRNFTMQGLGLRIYLMRLADGAEPAQVFSAAAADQRPLWVGPSRRSPSSRNGRSALLP